MHKILRKLEDMATAVAFAEAGDDQTARHIMSAGDQKTKVARKRPRQERRPRQEKRLEMRAPGPRE